MMRSYQIGLYEKAMPPELSWRESLTLAGELGYDFVEISIDETDARLSRLKMPAAQRMEFLKVMGDTGVPVRSMCLSAHRRYPMGSHDPAIRMRSMEIMEDAVRLAADLGVRMIQLAGYDVYYETGDAETRRLFAENLEKAVTMAAASGVLLGFETMETPFMNTVEKAMAYVRRVNSPYLGVYPDLGNITNSAASKEDAAADLETGRGHLIAMHLKETLPGVFREVPFGTGHVDFVGGIGTAWSLGIRRYVTEMWYTGSESWRADILSARKRMTDILDQMEAQSNAR